MLSVNVAVIVMFFVCVCYYFACDIQFEKQQNIFSAKVLLFVLSTVFSAAIQSTRSVSNVKQLDSCLFILFQSCFFVQFYVRICCCCFVSISSMIHCIIALRALSVFSCCIRTICSFSCHF